MKSLIVFSALLALSVAYYPDTYDKFDADHAYANEGYTLLIIGCYLDAIPCNPAHEFFKEHFPDALKTACSDCSPAQKHIFKKFFEYADKYYPKHVALFWSNYDHEFTLKANFLDAIKNS